MNENLMMNPSATLFPHYKAMIACMGGNIIEWYDFMIYGYFSSIIGRVFFPSSSKTASLLLSLMLFAVGVIARPIGGILMGHIGDKISRKRSLMISVYLMFFATTIIGFLPTYNDIGVLAPIILFMLRIIQGLAMGGEYAGTMVFLIESAPPNKKGLYGSFAALSLVTGMFLGSCMTTLIQRLPEEKILAWGWRIPFFMSVTGIFYTLYMRNNLTDSAYFKFIKENKQTLPYPFKEMCFNYSRLIWQSILLQTVLAIGMYTITVYYINYIREYLSFSKTLAFTVNMIAMVMLGISAVISGWLSDYIGRKKILLIASFMVIICGFVSIYLISLKEINSFLLSQLLLTFSFGQFLGVTPIVLAEIFPTQIRYTAIAFTNNVCMGIFGGTAPLVMFYGTHLTDDPYFPAYYLALGAIISIIYVMKIYYKSSNLVALSRELG